MSNTMRKLESNSDTQTCDCNRGNDNMTDDKFDIDVSSLTVDAVRDRNENVDERIENLESDKRSMQDAAETLETLRERLDVDGDESVTEAVEVIYDHAESLEEELTEYQEQELDDLRQSIVDASDYTMDDIDGKEKDELEIINDAVTHAVSDASDDDEGSLSMPTNDASDGINSGSGGLKFSDVNYDRQIN